MVSDKGEAFSLNVCTRILCTHIICAKITGDEVEVVRYAKCCVLIIFTLQQGTVTSGVSSLSTMLPSVLLIPLVNLTL